MAGGDGSQAMVAAVASEHSLPYACVPAGTRNHFALDLGVDRDDVVGALDAFVDGAERVVDLADVNGRVFVNNVSLGIYGEAVQRPGYRNAKLRTLLEAIPHAIDPGPPTPSCAGPTPTAVGRRATRRCWSPTTPTVSSSVSGRRVAPGSTRGCSASSCSGSHRLRPALFGSPPMWRAWSAPSFVVESGATTVAAGVDGEAAQLEVPLHFRTRPGALKVRIARGHPGAAAPAIGRDR